VETLLWRRIDREVRAFAGLIDVWDVVNEAVVMPDRERWGDNPISQLSRRMGTVELVRQCFQAARQANPRARLILNDYDVTPAYEHLIEQCLAGGVDITAIGIQSHMHRGHWGAAKAEDVCRRFSRFGKPLHFTETTILSGALKTDDDWHGPHPGWDSTPEGEASQAAQVAEFVGILRSCPAVEAMTWWDLSDNGAWQQAPAGLLRKDMSPKPAYQELSRLLPRP